MRSLRDQRRRALIEGGFWTLNQPVKMADGNWIIPGVSVGNGHRAAVAISHGDDFLKWDLVVIPAVEGLTMWGESSIIVDGPNVTNIARFGAKAQALIAVSKDYDRTWIASAPSNLPMATQSPPPSCSDRSALPRLHHHRRQRRPPHPADHRC